MIRIIVKNVVDGPGDDDSFTQIERVNMALDFI